MTFGEFISSMSTVSNTTFRHHLLNLTNLTINIKRIKSFEVKQEIPNINVVYTPKSYKVVIKIDEPKIVYNPDTVSVTNQTTDTKIVKGN